MYKRVLLKLSGESLAGSQGFGVEPSVLNRIAKEVSVAHQKGVEIGIVVGGGNIFRGISASVTGMDRVSADYMGMLATGINSLALQDALERLGVVTRVMSAIEMNEVCEPFITRKAKRHLERGRVVVFACGTGNPYFTTDTAASLRAKEIGAQVILKATKVDGIYDKNPDGDSSAKLYDTVTYLEVLKKQLKVMDATAVSLCMEQKLPIIVFNVTEPDNITKVMFGEKIGTRVLVD